MTPSTKQNLRGLAVILIETGALLLICKAAAEGNFGLAWILGTSAIHCAAYWFGWHGRGLSDSRATLPGGLPQRPRPNPPPPPRDFAAEPDRAAALLLAHDPIAQAMIVEGAYYDDVTERPLTPAQRRRALRWYRRNVRSGRDYPSKGQRKHTRRKKTEARRTAARTKGWRQSA